MITGEISSAVAQLGRAVDALLAAPLEADALPEVISAVERHRHRLEAVDQRLFAEAASSGLAARFGQPGLAGALATLLRVDGPEARRRVARAEHVAARRALTGEPLPPLLPTVARAVVEGAVSPAQVDVIVECLDRIPHTAPVAVVPVAERLLVEAAAHEAPRLLRRTAAELLARLDPDGVEPVEDEAERKRGFSLVHRPDGTSSPRGTWTAEVTALWEAILDPLSAPQPSGEGIPDPRSPAQRRHDAMAEAALRLLRSDTLPAAGGVPVTVLATTTISELSRAAGLTPAPGSEPEEPGTFLRLDRLAERAGLDLAELLDSDSAGLALLGHGQTVSARSLLTLACEAQVVPVIFDDTGGVLAYGQGRRLATRGQRLALVARDGGCCFPGCDRPAAWTEVHHVVPWAAGGGTDLDDLCLLCRYHHRQIDKSDWQVRIDQGVPTWTPPAWLDPHRTPRRNTVHHRPDFDFRQPTAA